MPPKRARSCIALVCAGLLGCGTWDAGGEGVEITRDERLASGLHELSRRGESGQLRDLTDWTWEEVHVFSEGVTRERVEAVVGAPVLRDERYYTAGNLLVFEKGGEVVKAVSIIGDVLKADQPTWPSEVRLEPLGDARPAILRLTLPTPQR